MSILSTIKLFNLTHPATGNKIIGEIIQEPNNLNTYLKIHCSKSQCRGLILLPIPGPIVELWQQKGQVVPALSSDCIILFNLRHASTRTGTKHTTLMTVQYGEGNYLSLLAKDREVLLLPIPENFIDNLITSGYVDRI